MKKLLLILALLTGTGLTQTSFAQVNVNINIGSQPIWGPTGYEYVDYYYLPDLDIYYYVPQRQWIYFESGRWITAAALPPRYQNYDLYRLHKVVINQPTPYLRNQTYRKQYAQFKGRNDQQPIRDSRDSNYFVINDHPQHGKMAAGNRGNNQPMNGRVTGQPGRNPNQRESGRGAGRDRVEQGRDRGPR